MLILLLRIATLTCLVVAIRGVRWAYVMFIALSLLSFPARRDFQLDPRACELLVGLDLALYSFRNFPHIILFALFALLSRRQFRGALGYGWAFIATIMVGLMVEAAQGLSGQGHCRMRDLLPDGAGAIIGLLGFEAGRKIWQSRFAKTQ